MKCNHFENVNDFRRKENILNFTTEAPKMLYGVYCIFSNNTKNNFVVRVKRIMLALKLSLFELIFV